MEQKLMILKKELKRFVVIAKRIVPGGIQGMVIEWSGKNVTLQAKNEHMIASTVIDGAGEPVETALSLRLDPRVLEAAIPKEPKRKKGEKKVPVDPYLPFSYTGSALVEPVSKQQVAVKEAPVFFSPKEAVDTTPLQHQEAFKNLLRDADSVCAESRYESTNYLCLHPKGGIAMEERRVHCYFFQEDFAFSSRFLPKSVVKVLVTTCKKDISYGMYRHILVLEHEGVNFYLNAKDKMDTPSLKQNEHGKIEAQFSVDSRMVNDALAGYKKADVKHLYGEIKGNNLVLTPVEEGFSPVSVPLLSQQGTHKKRLFDSETLKGFFRSYSGDVTVQSRSFTNNKGECGYMWMSFEPEKMTMIAGITEPDHEKEWREARRKQPIDAEHYPETLV